MSSRHDLGEQKRWWLLGEPGEWSSLRRTEVLICKFIKRSSFFRRFEFWCSNSGLGFPCSTASDVDPGNVLSSRTPEPVATEQSVVRQTATEQPVEQPAVVATTEVADEDPARGWAGVSTPTRGDATVGTPPPSSVAEEGHEIPSPAPVEEGKAPSPTPAVTPTQEGSPNRGKGPMIPVTVAGGSTKGGEAQATSNDEVEEI